MQLAGEHADTALDLYCTTDQAFALQRQLKTCGVIVAVLQGKVNPEFKAALQDAFDSTEDLVPAKPTPAYANILKGKS